MRTLPNTDRHKIASVSGLFETRREIARSIQSGTGAEAGEQGEEARGLAMPGGNGVLAARLRCLSAICR